MHASVRATMACPIGTTKGPFARSNAKKKKSLSLASDLPRRSLRGNLFPFEYFFPFSLGIRTCRSRRCCLLLFSAEGMSLAYAGLRRRWGRGGLGGGKWSRQIPFLCGLKWNPGWVCVAGDRELGVAGARTGGKAKLCITAYAVHNAFHPTAWLLTSSIGHRIAVIFSFVQGWKGLPLFFFFCLGSTKEGEGSRRAPEEDEAAAAAAEIDDCDGRACSGDARAVMPMPSKSSR